MNNSSSALPRSFGVFKPVGHVVVSLPSAQQAAAAQQALREQAIVPPQAITPYTDGEMLAQIDEDLAQASPVAAIGQELNLVRAHRELALRGYHWLVVKVSGNAQAAQLASCVKGFGAERAQHYGNFVIEELIEHADETAQVAESPDRGLDAQTPSGEEAERPGRHR